MSEIPSLRLVLRLVLTGPETDSQESYISDILVFKGIILASDSLSLAGPRIGYARLLVLRNSPNHSTIPDPKSVIYLGHSANVPLIQPRTDLGYRLEPHDHI